MKKPNILTFVMPICLAFWLALLFIQGFHIKSLNNVGRFSAQVEFVVHIFMLITVFKIYKNTDKENKKIMIWFFVAAIFLFINDMSFYAVTYFKNTLSINVPLIHFLIDLIPFFIWVFTISMFFSIILGKAISGRKQYLKVLLPLIFMDFIIICLFLSAIHYAFSILSAETISQASTFIVQLIVFDFAILCLIYSENTGFSLVLSGFIVLICGDFFLIYSFISQTDVLLAYGELLWLLGLFIILFGVLYLEKMKNYNVSTWVRKSTSIKSKLTIWFFSCSIVSFLLLFIIAYLFSMINKEVFLSLPLFIMLYSVIVITFSVFMGRCFETPFKKLENNIRALMLEDDMQKLDSSFSTEEFIFLQKFIVEAFEFKEAKDHAQKELGRMTAQVAHDIRSPLAALNTALKDIPELSEQKRILIRNATRRINDIANNLLLQYRITKKEDVNDGSLAGVKAELISSLLDSLISEKKMQFFDKQIDFSLNMSERTYGCFANIEANEFKRAISNLINNAVESLGEKGQVHVVLNNEEDDLIIKIIDNGTGIKEEVLPKIKEGGISVGKKEGFGLGIAGAILSIKKWRGSYDIQSKAGEGTTFVIKLPIAAAPSWFQSSVGVLPKTHIIVLDDDESIHNIWEMHFQEYVERSQIAMDHFYKPSTFVEYCKTSFLGNDLFLVDYELIGFKETGLDLIEQLNLGNRAILVTSRHEETEIMARIREIGVKIIPKSFAPYIQIKIIPSNPNIVLIDDNETLTSAWKMLGLKKGKKVATFNNIKDFEEYLPFIETETPIYIDSILLEDDVKGEEYSKKLYEMGFLNIYLETGKDIDEDVRKHWYWIKEVVGKNPPF